MTVFCCVILISVLGLLSQKTKAGPPSGFQTSLIIGSGLSNPTAFAFAPDGRIFILEQEGNIKIYKNGQVLPRIFDQLPSFNQDDRGLLGIAFDPDFDNNHWVYFYYIDQNSMHRVVRFDASLDVGSNGPIDIYKSNALAGSNHAGGTIAFGPDGKLYISIGDGGNAANAQDLTTPMGKILRINKDGSIPNGNPFVAQANAKGEIWAYGFRNPFRFQFDSQSGNLYLGDVGESTWEEINKVDKGGNYGWPLAEGNCTNNCANLINPIYSYEHTTPSFSVIGGPVYHASMFPEQYKGKLFFGDYAQNFLKTLSFNSDGSVGSVEDFDRSVGSIVDIKIAPDGSLYYLTIFPGQLFKVSFTNGNQIPTAVAGADVMSGDNIPLTVNFSSAGSSDPEGGPLTYAWDFGDGTQSSEQNPVKIYNTKGVYTVGLSVSDGVNMALANPFTVRVGKSPTINITAPLSNSVYNAGDTIAYAATATDGDGNSLPATAFTREVVFHHSTHSHPFLRPAQSQAGSFVVPTSGETSTDVWYEIIMTVTDSAGISASQSVTITSQISNLTFITDPPNLQITVAGIPQNTPVTTAYVVGFSLDVSVQNQNSGGTAYEFDHWSDGGAKQHDISVSSSNTIYTAFFRPATPFRGEYFNNINLSGSPSLVRDDQNINFIWNSGSPDPGINSDNFSARWIKQQDFETGRYKFITSTDDGVRLFIDGQLVIDKWRDQGETPYSTVLDLSAGSHEIKMEYYDAFGGAVAKLNWDTTTEPPTVLPQSSFNAEYFDNQNLSGTPKLSRNDNAIDFVWNNGSPGPTIPVNHFSARFSKQQNFEAGYYNFVATTDDGVRVYVDNEIIIDQWNDHPQTTFAVGRDLSAGVHNIKVEYFENGGGAIAKFNWQKMDSPPVPFEAQYFNNQNLSGPAVLQRQEPLINNFWQNGSPHPSINADHFSARWQRNEVFTAGNHIFTVLADDGVRLYIDGERIIDHWQDQPPTTYTVTKTLSAGTHLIMLEYFEDGGGATAALYEN